MENDVNEFTPSARDRQVVEATRAACVEAAVQALEGARASGLCWEGAWECAVGAMKALDPDAVIAGGSAAHSGAEPEGG